MLTVNGDQGVVERQLAGGVLACPSCGGVLGGWGHAAERRVRAGDGCDVRVRPRRSRCRECGVTHVLLPAWCLSRRADAAEVIGAALEAAAAGGGHRRIARLRTEISPAQAAILEQLGIDPPRRSTSSPRSRPADQRKQQT